MYASLRCHFDIVTMISNKLNYILHFQKQPYQYKKYNYHTGIFSITIIQPFNPVFLMINNYFSELTTLSQNINNLFIIENLVLNADLKDF